VLNGSNLYDREVIGWSLSEKMKAQDTSIAVLKMARFYRPLQDHSTDCVESSISALGNVTINLFIVITATVSILPNEESKLVKYQ